MRHIVMAALIASLTVLTACGGRQPEPVMVQRPGDESKNCELLIYDIENLEFEIYKLLPETKGKTLKNVGYGVAGLYTFFIPWLLIDFNNAEAKEYESLRDRHAYLSGIAKSKGCDVTPQQYPSLDEVKKDYELFKKTESKTELKTELNNIDAPQAIETVTKEDLMPARSQVTSQGEPQQLLKTVQPSLKKRPTYMDQVTYGRPIKK